MHVPLKDKDDDRRRAPRVDFECVVMIAHGTEGFVAQMENVSAVGCCTSRPDDWSLDVGEHVRLYLLIDLRHVFSAPARVAWASERFVGFEYLEPQPLPA
jgi:PilZ domain